MKIQSNNRQCRGRSVESERGEIKRRENERKRNRRVKLENNEKEIKL